MLFNLELEKQNKTKSPTCLAKPDGIDVFVCRGHETEWGLGEGKIDVTRN